MAATPLDVVPSKRVPAFILAFILAGAYIAFCVVAVLNNVNAPPDTTVTIVEQSEIDVPFIYVCPGVLQAGIAVFDAQRSSCASDAGGSCTVSTMPQMTKGNVLLHCLKIGVTSEGAFKTGEDEVFVSVAGATGFTFPSGRPMEFRVAVSGKELQENQFFPNADTTSFVVPSNMASVVKLSRSDAIDVNGDTTEAWEPASIVGINEANKTRTVDIDARLRLSMTSMSVTTRTETAAFQWTDTVGTLAGFMSYVLIAFRVFFVMDPGHRERRVLYNFWCLVACQRCTGQAGKGRGAGEDVELGTNDAGAVKNL